ncbi:MAG: response regulator transcription factor [Chitinophagaceae bacterium]|nr:response regulator transcription factor [Chitinophagaceae bacterium]
MTTIIIEDESIAAERLQWMLNQCETPVRVQKIIDTVQEAVEWLSKESPPDFILLDIHLADGSGFDIFHKITITTPVIFTTAYDQYALEAFKVMSIDYLLKPVSQELLEKALFKLKVLRPAQDSAVDYKQLIQLMKTANPIYKTRFSGKVGQKIFLVPLSDVAFFLADNKIVYLCARDGTRYMIEHTLENLETMIDPAQFFRANRSAIIHAPAIEQVKPYINSRLKLWLKHGTRPMEIIISRERVPEFKRWTDL